MASDDVKPDAASEPKAPAVIMSQPEAKGVEAAVLEAKAAAATQPAAKPAEPSVKAVEPAPDAKSAPEAEPAAAAPASPASGFVLPPAVYSPQLLESVTYDIERYLDWYRQTQIQKKVGTTLAEEPNHSDETVLVIEEWLGGQPATLESLEKLLKTLRELRLPEVHIMLAALPNHAQRLTLVTWFRTNVGPGLLMSFVADRNLGGGVVVRTPNRVFDYTWKQQLINGRDKLAEILRHV